MTLPEFVLKNKSLLKTVMIDCTLTFSEKEKAIDDCWLDEVGKEELRSIALKSIGIF
jgi:hypothetical protein